MVDLEDSDTWLLLSASSSSQRAFRMDDIGGVDVGLSSCSIFLRFRGVVKTIGGDSALPSGNFLQQDVTTNYILCSSAFNISTL